MKSSKNAVIIYHAKCYDGFLAAYAAWLKLGDHAKYVPMSYDDTLFPDILDKDVYFVDFSTDAETLNRMAQRAKSITVIDHHKTAEAELSKPLAGNIATYFDMSKSGCELTAHFFLGFVPWFFEYIGDRDIWKFKHPETKAFCAGFFAEFPLHDLAFEDLQVHLVAVPMADMRERETRDRGMLCAKGHTIMDYRNGLIDGWLGNVRSAALGLQDWNGHIGVVNGMPLEFISEMGAAALKDNLHFDCIAIVNLMYEKGSNTQVVAVSWRSDDGHADVSKIAKAFGGGGHRNAAGCTMTLELARTNNLI